MKTSKPTKTELEINDYIMANKGISYYDVLIFAYDNDLDKWIDLLKHTKYKKALSDTLRDIQIELGMFTVRLDEQLKLWRRFVTTTDIARSLLSFILSRK